MPRETDSGSEPRPVDFLAIAACLVAFGVSAAGVVREAPALREPTPAPDRPAPALVKLDPSKLSASAVPARNETVAPAEPLPAPAALPPVTSLPDLNLPELPAVPVKRETRAVAAKPNAAAPAAVTVPDAARNGTASRPVVLDVAQLAGEQPWPEYPYECLRRRESGVVKVRFHVEPDGSVRHARAADSSGCERLDDAAVGTILRRWRFPPGEVRHFEISIRFQLQ